MYPSVVAESQFGTRILFDEKTDCFVRSPYAKLVSYQVHVNLPIFKTRFWDKQKNCLRNFVEDEK